MPDTQAPIPARHYDTLLSPLDAAGQPGWLQHATPEQRRTLREYQAQGRLARREWTQLFASIQPLRTYLHAEWAGTDTQSIKPKMLLDSSAKLDLDLKYPLYLNTRLGAAEVTSAKQLAYLATLREEYSIATIQGTLGREGVYLLDWIIAAFQAGEPDTPDSGAYISSRPAVCASLKVAGARLPDIILLGPDLDDAPCVAFVPGHPRHPLKQYRSRRQFYASVRHDLLEPELQDFFSRFVAFKDFTPWARTCRQREGLLHVPIKAVVLAERLRQHVSSKMVERLLADAAQLIPADETQARHLGFSSMNYGAALTEHLSLGAGVGLAPAEEDEGQRPSDWLAPRRTVRVAKTYQYWLPDLSNYRLAAADHPTGRPDAQGIYQVGDQQVIAINQAFYRIETAPQGHRQIVHPFATDRYLPVLRGNGAGAWHHNLEQPQHWSRLALLRRLGPASTGFDDERLLRLAVVAGTRDAELRRVHELDQPPPPLLAHILSRARIHDQVRDTLALIAAGQPVPEHDQIPQLKAFYRAVAGGDSGETGRYRRSDSPTPAPVPCEENCTPPPAVVFEHWHTRLNRALFAHRYELAQLDTDHAVRELQRRYPHLPLSVAQLFLDANREALNPALATATGALPLGLAEQAGVLDADARLASALEGFTTPSPVNDDTLILAVRLLEYLEDWRPATALLLRRGNRFGAPLAELGVTDVETTSLYLDDDEGWSTASATQILLAQDMGEFGFYRALLYAFSEAQRASLGLGLNEPERLYQRLRELALARPTRARLLLGLGVRRSWLSPPAAAAVHRRPYSADLDLAQRAPAHLRLERLLTQTGGLPGVPAASYIRHLLRSNRPIDSELSNLERERLQLDFALHSWIDASADAATRADRSDATQQVLRAWESRITRRQANLSFHYAHLGELPNLAVALPAVMSFSFWPLHTGVAQQPRLAQWIQAMPNLNSLTLAHLPQPQLPEGLLNLRALRLLNLANSRLAPDALAALGRLGNLQTLNLSNLQGSSGHWSSEAMAQLTASGALQALGLEGCNASFGPGVFATLARLPELLSLNLRNNEVTLSDQDVSDLAGLVTLNSLDLSGNPLGQMPDLHRMHQLEELNLSRLHQTPAQWPTGLERLPRVQAAELGTLALSSVPVGAGRTRGLRIWGYQLPEAQRQLFEDEMREVGNTVHAADDSPSGDSSAESASGNDDSSDSDGPFDAGRNRHALRDAPALFAGLEAADRDRAKLLLSLLEPSLADFFGLLLRIDHSQEARRPGSDLRSRIQALIRGAFNADLRGALFDQAREAITCVDRDALVFAQLESLLRADQALAQVADESAAHELIALATSQWRSLRLQEHLAAQIAGWRRQGHVIDQSEIELYFRIALATRLGLRDQPKTQVFTSYTRWVTDAMLDAAYDAVVAPQGSLLPEFLSAQPYWQRFLDSLGHVQDGERSLDRASRLIRDEIREIQRWRDRLAEYLDAASSSDELPPALDQLDRGHLHQVLVRSGYLGTLDPLPPVLTLNSSQYRGAYDALASKVEAARLALTQALLEPQPGPSSRP